MRSTLSSSLQIAARRASSGVRGASYPAASAGRSGSGAGRALRSTLPLGVSGKAGSVTNADGTMASGSRSRRQPRSSPAAGASPGATR